MSSYIDYFLGMGISPPSGSGVAPSVYNGLMCPLRASFGRIHGTSPATCEIQYDDRVSATIGNKEFVQIGAATFIGIVVRVETETAKESGITTKIKLVDMRDRLHDINVFCQFNMLDSSGRWFHILPGDDWQDQRKTFINRLEAEDLTNADDQDIPTGGSCAGAFIFSAWSILNALGIDFEFSVTCSTFVYNILLEAKPENLDWNYGKKVIDCIEDLLARYGLQFTAWGDINIHVTLKGRTEDLFVTALVRPGIEICDFTNAYQASFGSELNDRGRRVVILGEQNRYEDYYPCRPAWNTNFDFYTIASHWPVAKLLADNDLDLLNQVKDLPDDWRHFGTWKGNKVEDMTIEDYLREFPFKVYVVDFSTIVDVHGQIQTVNEDGTLTPSGVEYDFDNYDWPDACQFPISEHLVTDTNRKFLAYATSRSLHRKGEKNPFTLKPELRTVVTNGVQLDIEESIVNEESCREGWKVRVAFNNYRFRYEDGEEDEVENYKPDKIIISVALNLEMFTLTKGDMTNSPRVREITKRVSNLQRGFVDGVEHPILASTNFSRDNRTDEANDDTPLNTVTASEIAEAYANRALFHEMITTAGYVTFHGTAGMMCDGIIESVNDSFDPENGIVETINFTSQANDDSTFPGFKPITEKKDFIYHDEEWRIQQQLRERANWNNKQVGQQAGAANDANQNGSIGGVVDWPARQQAFGANNKVLARVTNQMYEDGTDLVLDDNQLVVMKQAGGGEDQVS